MGIANPPLLPTAHFILYKFNQLPARLFEWFVPSMKFLRNKSGEYIKVLGSELAMYELKKKR